MRGFVGVEVIVVLVEKKKVVKGLNTNGGFGFGFILRKIERGMLQV
jgi:hypothetical protein